MLDLRYEWQAGLGRWDLVLEPGLPDPMLAVGMGEIDQRLRQCLRLFRGEWYLDQSLGVPYFQQILGIKGISPATVEQILRAELLRQPDVIRVATMVLEMDKVDRRLSVGFTAVTADGTVPIQMEVA